MDFFQTIVLINFVVPLRRDEAITWENFVPVKWYPRSTKEGGCFAGTKLFACNRVMKFMKSFYKIAGIPANRGRISSRPIGIM